jgi:hypothetical protein
MLPACGRALGAGLAFTYLRLGGRLPRLDPMVCRAAPLRPGAPPLNIGCPTRAGIRPLVLDESLSPA